MYNKFFFFKTNKNLKSIKDQRAYLNYNEWHNQHTIILTDKINKKPPTMGRDSAGRMDMSAGTHWADGFHQEPEPDNPLGWSAKTGRKKSWYNKKKKQTVAKTAKSRWSSGINGIDKSQSEAGPSMWHMRSYPWTRKSPRKTRKSARLICKNRKKRSWYSKKK